MSATAPAAATAAATAAVATIATTTTAAAAVASHLGQSRVDLLLGLLEDRHKVTSLLGI
jgi:hypothetical protein